MTQEEFDKYRFSINTKIKFEGEWWRVWGVNFDERLVIINIPSESILREVYIRYIEDIEDAIKYCGGK
jgi:hypothetical protein